MLRAQISGDLVTFLTISRVLHDWRYSQTVNLVCPMHVTEKFQAIPLLMAAVASRTYSVRVYNVRKLLVAQGRFCSRHRRVIHFLLTLRAWVQIVSAEGLLMATLPPT